MKTRKKGSTSKRRVAKGSARRKTGTRKATTLTKRRTPTKHAASQRKGHKLTGGETYLFECTRQGCGYRIVREEKYEQGQLRLDLKCPKCHNREFRCLGPGDLPEAETMDLTIPPPAIDLDNISPVDLGSN